MDKENKLKKLLEILTKWLVYSKLWNSAIVETIHRTKVERVKHETRKKWIGPGPDDYMEYPYTEQWTEKIPSTEFVKITYFSQKTDKFVDDKGFESIEFPMEDLDTRLEHYRNKLRNIKEKLQVTE